jgi:hypothetical protein
VVNGRANAASECTLEAHRTIEHGHNVEFAKKATALAPGRPIIGGGVNVKVPGNGVGVVDE